MTGTTDYQNVHGVNEFLIVNANEPINPESRHRTNKNIPTFASTVQKTKQWVCELMQELQWDDAQKTYRGLRAVLHALRDRLTIHESADFAAQLPMLLRGLFYEGWQPDAVPVKDRTKEAFLAHVFKAFINDQSVDPERLTRCVLKVAAKHVSEGEVEDIRAILPRSLHDLFPDRS